jgi:hypothetical protein
MKRRLTIILVFISSIAWGQDTAWKRHKVEHLSILLPGKVTRTDTLITKAGLTMDATILVTNQAGYALSLSVISGIEKSNDSEEKIFKDVGEGFCEGAKSRASRCVVKDTAIDKLPAKKGQLFMDVLEIPVNCYMVVMNDKLYNMTLAFTEDNEETKAIHKRFLAGIDFDNAAKRTRGTTETALLPYKIGKLIGSGVVIALIIVGVIFLTKKNRRKTQTNIS